MEHNTNRREKNQITKYELILDAVKESGAKGDREKEKKRVSECASK